MPLIGPFHQILLRKQMSAFANVGVQCNSGRAEESPNPTFLTHSGVSKLAVAIVPEMITNSTITCPRCGYQAAEMMPIDACHYFFDCKGLRRAAKTPSGRLLRISLMVSGDFT
jgi:hypothetical protein